MENFGSAGENFYLKRNEQQKDKLEREIKILEARRNSIIAQIKNGEQTVELSRELSGLEAEISTLILKLGELDSLNRY